jgi:biofilm PGA synthesis protein PgaD
VSSHEKPSSVRLPETIHRPDLQSRVHRNLFALLSTLGWLVWLYLFLPVASVLAWNFGFIRFNRFVLDDEARAWHTLAIYTSIIVAAGLVFVLWALYNLIRFRGKDRRASVRPVTTREMAQTFGVAEDLVVRLREAKVVVVHHDDHGHIEDIETGKADGTPLEERVVAVGSGRPG